MIDLAWLAPTIASIGTILIGYMNGRKSNRLAEQAETNKREANEHNAEAAAKQSEIHQLVNSNLDAVKAQLAAAKLEIAELRRMIISISEGKPGVSVTIPIPPPPHAM